VGALGARASSVGPGYQAARSARVLGNILALVAVLAVHSAVKLVCLPFRLLGRLFRHRAPPALLTDR